MITILFQFLKVIQIIKSIEVNTGILGYYGSPVQKVSEEFAKTTWTNQETHLRIVCDIDGDGKDDIVGFTTSNVIATFSNGSTFDSSIIISTEFSSGYTT